jgi:uncharacterized membrane protein
MEVAAMPKITGTGSLLPKQKRVESIDLLRGIVMIIMALDHVRDYFSRDALLFDPTDLDRTNVLLFFTRFITHYCAPVFVLLAGVSAYLSGKKKTKKELSEYLFTRGLWLIFAELFIVGLGWFFNPEYHYFNLQVIWAIGVSMIALSALIFLDLRIILFVGFVLVCTHNFLDTVHMKGNNGTAFLWAMLHEPARFSFFQHTIYVHYPVIPWIGLMALGYCIGRLYDSRYFDERRRKKILLNLGFTCMAVFVSLRIFNFYGDALSWSIQKNAIFTLLSILNVTKYPPSLLYVLITIGPALIFLALSEKPLTRVSKIITVYGRVPFFYYVLHIYLIHLFATAAAFFSGYRLSDMILSDSIFRTPALKGYGFSLSITYLVWVALVVLLYPFCKWYDQYKRTNLSSKAWLSYV